MLTLIRSPSSQFHEALTEEFCLKEPHDVPIQHFGLAVKTSDVHVGFAQSGHEAASCSNDRHEFPSFGTPT